MVCSGLVWYAMMWCVCGVWCVVWCDMVYSMVYSMIYSIVCLPDSQCVSYGVVWYGMVWYGIVWYGVVWCGMVWYGMVWYGMVWYGMVWYGMVWEIIIAFHGMKVSCMIITHPLPRFKKWSYLVGSSNQMP